MEVPKENVVDLRKPKRKAETRNTPPVEYDEFEVRREIKITALAITAIVLLGLTAYFAISKNYLASMLFVLAGVTLAISIYIKNKDGKETVSRIKTSKPESLTDILSKIIGL